MDDDTTLRVNRGADQDRTRWSLVAAAGRDAGPALTELCARYWCAAYAFIRRNGHPPRVAQELTSGFFRRLLHEHLQRIDARSCDRFRDFLLAALRRAMEDAWRSLRHDPEAAGVRAPLPVEILEDRFLAECGDHATPEQAFERSFAHAVVARSFERLRAEAVRANRLELYTEVEPFLHAEPRESDAAEVAAATGLGLLAATLTLRSLRQRLRELVNDEIARAIGDDVDPEVERRTLRIALPG